MDYPSYYDLKSENSYHVLLIGCLGQLFSQYPDIQMLSNVEAGHGRADIIIKAQQEKVKVIFELKKSAEEIHLERDAEAALIR